MNSNKIAVSVLILAFVVIVSSLFAASVTEPLSPEAAQTETSSVAQNNTSSDDAVLENSTQQSETESSAAEQTPSENVSVESDVQSQEPSVAPDESEEEFSAEEPDEPVSEQPDEQPEESDEPVESIPEQLPEESSEDELIRDPLGKEEEKVYKLTVIVKDIEGFTIEGADVMIDDIIGETDEMGKFYIELDSAEFVLNVKSGAFVSYYEEITLYDKNSVIEISLARADKIRKLLNSVELRPYVSGHAELDAAVNALFDELFYPGMETYDKVRACYDWVIEHTEYKRPYHEQSGYFQCAYQLIRDGIGTCNCYSNAFAVMMRYIGLECYVVEGTTTANSGGYTGHEWTTIKIDGQFYVFDPQVEDAIAGRNGGKVNYVRFCLPEPHAKYRYSVCSRDFFVNKFNAYLEENGYFTED